MLHDKILDQQQYLVCQRFHGRLQTQQGVSESVVFTKVNASNQITHQATDGMFAIF